MQHTNTFVGLNIDFDQVELEHFWVHVQLGFEQEREHCKQNAKDRKID